MTAPEPALPLSSRAHAPAPAADIERYYDAEARSYDAARFGNGYGRYLDRQERAILRAWLPRAGRVLELGCGTGRLLDLATDGLDRSAEMLAVARAKRPDRRLARGLAWCAPFPDGLFDAAFSMHVFMHLARSEIAATLEEARRLVRPGGTFVFDVPSAPRRALTRYQPRSWHCASALHPEELPALCDGWAIRALRGVLAFPVHRLPERLRPLARPLDTIVGRSPLRRWCSYYVVKLERSGP